MVFRNLVLGTLSLLLLGAQGNCQPTPPPCSAMDADGDGAHAVACGGTDCDDTDPRRFPGAAEVCDAEDRDEDCDPATFGFRDQDGDGAGDARCCNVSSGGDRTCGEDCDDLRRGTHPNQNEVCNDLDDDCDGASDEGVLIRAYVDGDRDNHGSPSMPPGDVCPQELGSGWALRANDCDDTNPAIQPGALVCVGTAGSSAYSICTSDGVYAGSKCSGGQQLCFPQPNGLGICL
ncbi:MAG: putative metal-binding motif-containing protein [Myxococcaceae bacterium]|nr:putative metal-binding motif-containing protein [Myxococcaceae bacterium]